MFFTLLQMMSEEELHKFISLETKNMSKRPPSKTDAFSRIVPDDDVDELDLHDCRNLRQALEVVDYFVFHRLQAMKFRKVSVITGRGSRSFDGVPRFKLGVFALLTLRGYKLEKFGEGGFHVYSYLSGRNMHS